MSETKVSRRGYTKYAGAGIVVVAVAGAGAYYATRPGPTPTPTPTVKPTETKPTTVAPTSAEMDKYEKAAVAWAKKIRSTIPQADVEKELLWFARAAKPYRGKTINTAVEAIPIADVEQKVMKPLFEELTGVTVNFAVGSDEEVMMKVMAEIEVEAGAYDFFSMDQGAIGMVNRRAAMTDVTAFMDAHPDLNDPYFDLDDIWRRSLWSNPFPGPKQGHITGVNHYTFSRYVFWRDDWLKDSKEREGFEKKFGYPLRTPLEWDTIAAGEAYANPDNWWSRDKMLDICKWFYRPDEKRYGTLINGKNEPSLSWVFDNWPHRGGVLSKLNPPPGMTDEDLNKDPKLGWQRAGTNAYNCRPNASPFGCYTDPDTQELHGHRTDEGGTTNSPAGQGVFEYFRELFNYGPPRGWEMEQVEVCLQMMSERDIAIADAIWVGAFIRGWIQEDHFKKNMQMWHMPVDKRYWTPGMVTHDDISDLVLTKAGKNKEPAWLYIQFTMSKATDIYKHLDLTQGGQLCNMVRLSTLYSSFADEYDKISKGIISSLRNKAFIDASSDDPAYIDRAGLVRTLHPLWAKFIRDKNAKPSDVMTELADALDKLARDTGAMK